MIHHLFFANDSLLVFWAQNSEVDIVKGVIGLYASTLGQQINLGKSFVCFSRNVSHLQRFSVCAILGVDEKEELGTYLGLPTRIGTNKKEVFSFIKNRVWKKLSSWKLRCLSRADKEIMLKTVLQAFPNYVMNLFLLSKMFGYELQLLINNFGGVRILIMREALIGLVGSI